MKSKRPLGAVIVLLIIFLAGCGSSFSPEFRVMDIYSYRVTDLPWDKQLEFEMNNARFFAELEAEHNAFIVDTSNFQVIDGQRAWEIHEQHYLSGEFEHFWPSAFCPHGRSIAVSIHYFTHNPIEPVGGGTLLDHVVFDNPYTLNILVPQSLHEYEEDIIAAYRWSFWFNLIEVENIYHEFIGTPLNETPQEDLHINIIWVESNQSYFTFDSRIESDKENLIIDPVVRVLLPDAIHPAQLGSIMQIGVFLYGTDWNTRDFDTGRDDLVVNDIRRLR